MDENRFIIYGLVCPIAGCVRYVGQSRTGMTRPEQHRKAVQHVRADGEFLDHTHKGRWIRKLQAAGLDYSIVILACLPTAQDLDVAEGYWIAFLRDQGCPLTNATAGGEGFRCTDPEVLARHRASLMASWTPARRVLHGAMWKRLWADPGYRSFISAALRRGHEAPAVRAAASARARKQWSDPVARANMSELKSKQGREPAYREKMSRSHGGRAVVDQHGRLYVSAADAARAHSVSPVAIHKVLRRKMARAKGFSFRYVDEVDL